jgi:hypothetical protein
LLTKLTPLGSAPVFVSDAAGLALVSTLKLPGILGANVALAGLVKVGACVTVRVNIWTALGSTPLAAVIVNE